ncbi:MAG: tRNA (adenosine(37)-N6)-threonylcarbamoyltransferase complex dimerization subunit type 1 TsaB [Moraxellaceae bacterium]|nr:MAG: tRNA (adenosine(37)-N6)-threonylcarbamoyltransferase complex dimerization subunit type 1 TsaB [Moraxellaceae bacterium]
MKKLYLAVDTTTEACSVALGYGSEIRSRYTEEPRQHANLVLPMVDELLTEAGVNLNQLSGIVFCQGPGAFTGLRIGAGVVQGLAFSADLPVVGISTLATIAQRAFREHNATKVHAAIDARMGEIYWGSYLLSPDQSDDSSLLMKLQGDEKVIKPVDVLLADSLGDFLGWVGCGTGWTFASSLGQVGVQSSDIYAELLPHAADALKLGQQRLDAGEGIAAELALPHYVRNNVAKKKSEQGPK